LHISVIKALNKTSLSKNFEFQVIGEPRFSDIYSKIGNVNYLSGISDKSLLETYQNADILLMPLTDATANNGILEGMACGIPIVVTDVGGIKDYVDDCFARLLPLHDVEAMIESVITLSNDNEMRKSMGQLARLKAEEKFSWKNIATRMIDLYDSIS
jgi:glycosyltransferase involved in cell wall biosynthesis